MKKFLALLLVLGMASSASAILQISVDGDPEPVDSQITILPSDTLILDIWTDTGLAMFQSQTWQLVCDVTLGTVGYDGQPGVKVAGDGSLFSPPYTVENAAIISPAGMEGVAGLAVTFGGIAAGTVLFDQILFHCDAEGDVILQLWDAPDGGAPTTLLDQVIIHQVVPEPMTVALLGLGGLFLLRRRK